MTVTNADGSVIEANIPVEPSAPRAVEIRRAIAARFFDQCPICGGPPTTLEHVPPEAIGGRKLTRTCEPCNNRLGTHVEADLCDWVDHAISLPRFSADTVLGNRKSGRLLVRETTTGSPFMIFEDLPPAGLKEMLASGQIDLSAHGADINNVRIAILKQLYLAECLDSGIPQGPLADQIRHELITARDAPSRRDVPISILSTALNFYRITHLDLDTSTPLATAVATFAADTVAGIVLAGRVFVSTTLTHVPTRLVQRQQDLSTRMYIGTPTPGIVTSVQH